MVKPLAGAAVLSLLFAVAAPLRHDAHAEPAAGVEIDAGGSVRPPALRRGESAAFTLPAAAGDYVAGRVEAKQGRVDLDLVAPDGRPLRRLASNVEGVADFQFVAEGGGAQLRATAVDDDAQFVLRVTRRLPEAAQHPPPPSRLSPKIAALAARLSTPGAVDAFWAEVEATGTPLVEPASDGEAIVTFLARGARRGARLFGGPSADHDWLDRLGSSDVWFKSYKIPGSTRLAYQIALDPPELPADARERRMSILATAKADPLNPRVWPQDAPDAYNQESTLDLPNAPEQPGIARRGAPEGSLSTFEFVSGRLGDKRLISIYRPAGFNPDDSRNALLFLFDGPAYLTRTPTPTILDNLIAEGRIPPTVAVFVSPIDLETRARQLPDDPAFADFMAFDLRPRVEAEIGARIPAERAILAGSSFGGLAAARIALAHPEAFGGAISLSGSFWLRRPNAPDAASESLAAAVAAGPRRNLRFHLAAGLFETALAGDVGILDATRHLRDAFIARGYPTSYLEYAAGHDHYAWRGALGDGLIAFWSNRD